MKLTARRNPLVLWRLSGAPPTRLAERTKIGMDAQLPPRRTRDEQPNIFTPSRATAMAPSEYPKEEQSDTHWFAFPNISNNPQGFDRKDPTGAVVVYPSLQLAKATL